MTEESLLNVINHYGVNHQISKLLEEVGELIEAILEGDKQHIEEEFADVNHLLEQFKVKFNLDNDNIIEIIKFKNRRQNKRIEKE